MKKSSGIGVVEVLLVIVTLGLIAALGWIYFNQQAESENQANKPVEKVKKEPTKPKEKSKKPKAPVEEAPYTFDDAYAGINKTVKAKGCASSRDKLTVLPEIKKEELRVVDDNEAVDMAKYDQRVNSGLTHAIVQYGCGSSGSVAVLKRDGKKWNVLSESARIYPICATIEGQGVPRSIVNACYPSDDSTDPVGV